MAHERARNEEAQPGSSPEFWPQFVALDCGFVSASHFSKRYREFAGKTQREERRGVSRPSAARRLAAASPPRRKRYGRAGLAA